MYLGGSRSLIAERLLVSRVVASSCEGWIWSHVVRWCLVLLLIRVAENRTNDPWRNLGKAPEHLHSATF